MDCVLEEHVEPTLCFLRKSCPVVFAGAGAGGRAGLLEPEVWGEPAL